MSAVKLTIRLEPSQFRILKTLAEQHEIPRYRMLSQIINRGFAATTNGADRDEDIREIARETGRNSARLIALERLAERSLFTGCAAYIYAREAACKHGRSEDAMIADARAAFERQRAIAEELNDETS